MTLATSVNDITAWGFYLQMDSQQAMEELLAVRPEYVCRGFFDWGRSNGDYPALKWMIERAHADGILFEGGISFSPVRPRQGEMTAEEYADLTTHSPAGGYTDPAPNVSYRQAAIHNPKVIDWFLAMAQPQIAAGIDGLHIDEIEGPYPWRGLGFDRHAVAGFRRWLIARYRRLGWTLSDARWYTDLGIDLDLHGGSMEGFDFIQHLRARGLAEDIEQPALEMQHEFAFQRDAVGREWGNAWSEAYAGTFQFDEVERIWSGAVERLKKMTRQVSGKELIVNENMNWTARQHVDYTMAHGELTYHNGRGEFDLAVSCAARIEQVKAMSLRRAGKVPVVFFIDWGHGFSEMDVIPPGAVDGYLHKLAAETAAAGTFLSLPIRGGGYHAASGGYLDVCAEMAAFFRREKRLFLPAEPWELPAVDPARQLTVRGWRGKPDRIHLVNHRTSGQAALALRQGEELELPLPPGTVVGAWSFEWQGERRVEQVKRGAETALILPPFETYCILEVSDHEAASTPNVV